MKLILLSGGSGKRLWPLSNETRSKQFLKILSDGNGGLESMIQRVWKQLKNSGLHESAFFTASKPHIEILHNQLSGEGSVIFEPEKRDTYPAIALASTYLYSMAGIGLNETVIVLPVDHYAEDGFFRNLGTLEAALHQSGANLALMGVIPTYPSEKYGYIIPENQQTKGTRDYYRVLQFKEKPDTETAGSLIERNAFWNCGVFAFKLHYMIDHLIDLGLPIQYEEMIKQYGKLEKTSFDYAVVEKAGSTVVLPYEGSWKDLGTWSNLVEEMSVQVIGNGLLCENSKNTHLINELDIPVTVIGLSDAVVVTSADGILVSDKSSSHKLKEVMNGFEQRPMYEERRWGWYRVLDFKKFDQHDVLTKRLCVLEGKNISYQYHLKRNEVWTVISGEGEFICNDVRKRLRAGDVVHIPIGSRHSIRAVNELEIIEVQHGTELTEEDIIRITFNWEDIETFELMGD